MPASLPTLDDIAMGILRDTRNQLPDASIASDSDNAVRANATASALSGLYQFGAWVLRQAFPDTADPDWLVMHARLRGLSRKAAVAASGTIQLTGKAGTVLKSGIQWRPEGGVLYQTTTPGTVTAAGTLTLPVRAMTPGIMGNLSPGTRGALTSAPEGMDSTVSVITLTGGSDTESDPALLARLLDVLRQPAAGGNAHDYKVWAESVGGVAGAWVYPLRRGLGTVDVVITATGGLPSADTVRAVQTYIDRVRPVTAKDCQVLAPAIMTVEIAVSVGLSAGTTLADVTPGITAALQRYFDALIPGQEAIATQMGALVSDVPGVLDYSLTAPQGNIIPTVDGTTVQWVRPGKVTVSELKAST